MVKWPVGRELRDLEYVFLIAVAGHVAAGKNQFRARLIDSLSAAGVPIEFQPNHKNRSPRPSEIAEESFLPWPSKKPAIVWEREGDAYGISNAVLDSIKENRVHQIIDADIKAIPLLRSYFAHHQLPNRVIPIGLYCDEKEAQYRIVQRETYSITSVNTMVSQLNTLKSQIPHYKNHHRLFRYLFYNQPPLSNLEHLVDRAIDLLGREERANKLDSTQPFINRYMTDSVNALFHRPVSALESAMDDGKIKAINFDEKDFSEFRKKHGQKDDYGEISEQYLSMIADTRVTDIVNSYGIVNILLEWNPGNEFNSKEAERRRKILQQLLEIKLGEPQYVNNDGLGFKVYSDIGKIECIDNMFSPIITFSSHDMFPLLSQSLQAVKETPHTLAFHYYMMRNPNSKNIIHPLTKDYGIWRT